MKTIRILLLLACILLLSSCAAPQEQENNVLIYAALNPVAKELDQAVERFNKSHPDIQIEIHDYSDEGGPERLMTELVLGQVPDMMEMQRLGYYRALRPSGGNFLEQNSLFDPAHIESLWFANPFDADTSDVFYLPYRQLAKKGFLEDLWPYIEKDPEFGRDKIVEAPLKAAEVDGGLYMLFRYVSINTLVGARSVVGDRSGWTLEELIAAYSAMPAGSTVLRYETTKWDVFSHLIAPALDQFIDWETGECFFDTTEFQTMLEFLGLFPDEVDTWLTPIQMREENVWRKLDGLQMLEPVSVAFLCSCMENDVRFGEPTACIGYPTADGSPGNSFILHGNPVAMTSTCRDKGSGVGLLSRMLRAESKSFTWMADAHGAGWVKMPLNAIAYRVGLIADMEIHKVYYIFPSQAPVVTAPLPTAEDRQRFEELVNNTTRIYWPDSLLSDSVWTAIAPYFSGDKTLEDTIDLVQRRVSLYVNENR